MAETAQLTFPDPCQKLEELYGRLCDVKRVIDRLQAQYQEEARLQGYDKVEALHFMIGDLHADLAFYLYPEGAPVRPRRR